MAARKRKSNMNSNGSTATATMTDNTTKPKTSTKQQQKKELDEKLNQAKIESFRGAHFVPMLLLFTVLVCSGFLGILSYRDTFGTGKVIFGDSDEAMLKFTSSTKWFDDSKGWKSSQGGFSAVQQFTSDENDMGGFFVRKIAGAAGLSFHLQKLIPLLFQSSNVHWGMGHFTPMLCSSVLGNFALAGYYMEHIDDFKNSDASMMAFAIVSALVFEAIIIIAFLISLITKQKTMKKKVVVNAHGKSPKAMVSNIVTRTVCIVSGLITLIAGRDFFFPGTELPFPPFDDIYLEWTGAFIHSPPPNSIEEEEHGLEAPIFIGDKFISRLGALYLLIICFQKFVSVLLVRIGKDDSGTTKCRLFWQAQAVSDGLILFTIRVFASAAKTASFDIKWHVMSLGYELFILGIYGFF
jgi:hypothetical protein